MYNSINNLIKESESLDKKFEAKLISIAEKVVKRKNHLVIDILDMESFVDKEKVTEKVKLDRVEVDTWLETN